MREYKEMVHSIHEAGLGVIMDVVYNHTFNVHDSCFYKTAGNYFYRMLMMQSTLMHQPVAMK